MIAYLSPYPRVSDRMFVLDDKPPFCPWAICAVFEKYGERDTHRDKGSERPRGTQQTRRRATAALAILSALPTFEAPPRQGESWEILW